MTRIKLYTVVPFIHHVFLKKHRTRMIRLCSLLFVAFLTLPACSSPVPLGSTRIAVYYPCAPVDSVSALESVNFDCPVGEDILQFALNKLCDYPDNVDLLPLFRGSATLDAKVSGSVVELTLPDDNGGTEGLDLTLARAAIVLTLTGLDGIQSVSIHDGVNEPVLLRASDYILDTLTLSGERNIAWYFPDSSYRYAFSENRTLTLRENERLEWYLLEELISGPKSARLEDVIPEGTRLLGFRQDGFEAVVDFSEEFIKNVPESALRQRMTLCCLVGTLTAQPGITSVRILVDGQPANCFGRLDISQPLTRDKMFLAPSDSAGGIDMTFWFPDTANTSLLPVPVFFTAQALAEDRIEVLALEKLIAADTPAGQHRVMADGVRLLSLTQTADGYIVNLSQSFSRVLPPCKPELCIAAIAALLDGISPGAEITFMVDGETLDSFFGAALDNPVKADKSLLRN